MGGGAVQHQLAFVQPLGGNGPQPIPFPPQYKHALSFMGGTLDVFLKGSEDMAVVKHNTKLAIADL